MNEINSLLSETTDLSDNIYEFVGKPNKSKSKKLRLQLGELKKKITEYRRILIELDSKGY